MKYTDMLTPFVALNCHVDKQMIWRTMVKQETSTLQNIQDTDHLYTDIMLDIIQYTYIMTRVVNSPEV